MEASMHNHGDMEVSGRRLPATLSERQLDILRFTDPVTRSTLAIIAIDEQLATRIRAELNALYPPRQAPLESERESETTLA